MSEKIDDASVFIAPDDTYQSTSSDYHYLSISGDTILVATERNPASNATGNVGEICFGHQTVLFITTYYIYRCIAANTWVRAAFSAY